VELSDELAYDEEKKGKVLRIRSVGNKFTRENKEDIKLLWKRRCVCESVIYL